MIFSKCECKNRLLGDIFIQILYQNVLKIVEIVKIKIIFKKNLRYFLIGAALLNSI